MPQAIGVDIGGTHFRLAIVDDQGRFESILKFPSESHRGPKGLIDKVISAIIAVDRTEELTGIGIGIAGAVNHLKGEVKFSPNMPGWDHIALADIIAAEAKKPVVIDNDVNLIALGEKWKGAGRPYENFICIALGTGVGGGLILNSDVWRGCGTAGEIGHMTIDRNGAHCNCGNYGCLETVASATGLMRLVRQEWGQQKTGLLVERFFSPENITPRILANAAKEGDSWAKALFEELGKALGVALASTMNLLCLDAVIIGGGIAESWDLFIGSLRAEYLRRVMPGTKPDVPIVPSELDDAAGILGAAALVFRKMGQKRVA